MDPLFFSLKNLDGQTERMVNEETCVRSDSPGALKHTLMNY